MRRVVFILGTGHCGSTLIELILASHPDVFGLGEVKNSLWQSGEKLCEICEGECPYWDNKASHRIMNLYFKRPKNRLRSYTRAAIRYYRSIYSYFFDWFGAQVLIDSTKAPEPFLRRVQYRHQWRDIQPMVIYVVRDGRAVINSYYRKYPEQGIEAVIADWMDRIKRLNKVYAETTFPKRLVHYEDIASEPEKVTKELCEFIGIDYRADMLEYWKHDHHNLSGNAGTKSMIYRYRNPNSKEAGRVDERHKGYYSETPTIKLDLRWRRELLPEHRVLFESMVGDLNEPFAYDDKSPVA